MMMTAIRQKTRKIKIKGEKGPLGAKRKSKRKDF